MIVLPYPPSANRIWRNVAGKTLKSREYRTWLAEAVLACRGARRSTGKYRLELYARRPDNRRRDIDNLIKPCSDALVAAGVVDDDRNAESVLAAWAYNDDAPAGVLVKVCPA